MNAKTIFRAFLILLILFSAVFMASYNNYVFAAGENGANELYSQCVRLYGEYKDAVKNNSGREAVDACFQRYRAALDKYKEFLNKNGAGNAALQDTSALPEAAPVNPLSGGVQDAVNSGVSTAAPSAAGSAVAVSSGAKTGGVVMASVLNIRSGPWGEVIGQMKAGAKVEIISRQGSWYKVLYNGREAYIHAGYIATENSVAAAYEGFVTSEGLNVRSGPYGAILGELKKGAAIEVLEKKGEWLVIKYNGREAYVHSDYISKNSVGGAVSGAGISSSAPASAPASLSASSTAAAVKTVQASSGVSNANFSSGADMIGGPVPPARVTSTFGPRDLFGKNFHYGVDLGVPTGTPLRSLGEGKVISTGYDYGGGKMITIKYDNGMTSSYAHCRDANVAVGSTVKKGDVVGHTNNTGAYTTGPHLHFTLKDASGKYINPLKVPSVWY